VYPYREEFLKAVEEHQIVIIVAETGAGGLRASDSHYCG
jgi:HrpA-like RNA helicase